VILNKKYLNKKISFIEKLVLVIVGFFYFPLLISIPYYFSIYDLTFINSYFESISGFTSTGFTIFEDVKKIDEPLLIWRSSSQWLGGIYFLYSLLLLAGTSKSKIKNLYFNFESLSISEIKDQYIKIFLIYFFLNILIFLILTLSDIRLFDGLNLSMTLISSGGFLTSNFLEEIIRQDNQKLIISICMLIPFFNLYLIYNLFVGNRSLENNLEDFYLSVLLLFFLACIYIFFNNIYEFNSVIFAVISSLTNIGLGFRTNFPDLTILFLVLVIIGGASFSTTSGIKFIKLYALFKFSLKEIYLIVKPLYVSSNTLFLSKQKIKDEEIYNYFLAVVFFIITLFILSGILAFEDISFKNSFTLSILTITNTVNSSNFNLSDFSFLNLKALSKLSLILFMIIGRVELLSILILIKKLITK